MVASRSDSKRRRRDSSPLNSNLKRTKVHAQRKFAQGVSSLSNLITLTPVKDKFDKPRNSGSSANLANGLKGSNSSESQSDVGTAGKRALPARGAKKPSIEDMITFLCYRGTSALPPHLVHLNKAPSPEPASQTLKGATESSRSKLADKTNKDGDKGNNKKTLKSAASSAQKAVNAAQALKRKYQEQRIKKTTVSTLANKVKAAPLLRSTRSTAGAITNLSSKASKKKITGSKAEVTSLVKKKDTAAKDESARKSVKTLTSKSSGNKSSIAVTLSGGNRGGLRSGGPLAKNVLRSGTRIGSNVSQKKSKKASANSLEGANQQSKKLATSLSDFSSEDDQPLIKKHKPLVQVQKLIKKSIASIGRKIKLEPRRSQRGLSGSPLSPTASVKSVSGGSQQTAPISTSHSSGSKDDDVKLKTAVKKVAAQSTNKEGSGATRKNHSNDNEKKESPMKMRKGYVMELVRDSGGDSDPGVLETRSRRGSRDLRDSSTDEKGQATQSTQAIDQSKKSIGGAGKIAPTKPTTSLSPSQVELSLSAVLKSPPDLRIPPSIKRPLTAVGITNPMAIAAAAAVVCKTSSSKVEDKGKLKDSTQSKDASKDTKENQRKEPASGQSKPNKHLKGEGKIMLEVQKSQEDSDSKVLDSKKIVKQERAKSSNASRKKLDDASEDDNKQLTVCKDPKKAKIKVEAPREAVREINSEEDTKPMRTSRRSGLKGLSEEDETSGPGKTVVSNKKSSDDDEPILSIRTRRSNIRSSKKTHSSGEEESNVSIIQAGRNLLKERDSKSSIQLCKMTSTTDNESELDSKSKKYKKCIAKDPLSGEEVSTRGSNKDKNTTKRSYKEDSSSNDGSDDEGTSDASLPTVKPSTRSAAKTKVVDQKLSRSTRSGKKTSLSEQDVTRGRRSYNQKLEDTCSEDESDSDRDSSPAIPRTRSKAVQSVSNKRDASESSGDEAVSKSLPNVSRSSRRSTAAKKTIKSIDPRSTSSESSDSSSQDVDADDNFSVNKSQQKMSANRLHANSASNKTKGKTSSVGHRKPWSDDDSDAKRKKTDSKGRDLKTKGDNDARHRLSRSPRRSSRRSLKTKSNDSRHDSSFTEASSSDSSPSHNQRVLRQRRGFFSFAEVDPPSDSEEEVIAATKASLEMISQQRCPETEPAIDPKKVENPQGQSSGCLSQEYDNASSKQSKNKQAEIVKGAKTSKLDPPQPKKSLSKKRVKPASEVQPNLNEELEKTLLSINLSPQVSQSPDKSSAEVTRADTMVVLGPANSSPMRPTLTSLQSNLKAQNTSTSPTTSRSKQRKIASKPSLTESPLSSASAPSDTRSISSAPLTPTSSALSAVSTIRGVPATMSSSTTFAAPAIVSMPTSLATSGSHSVMSSCGLQQSTVLPASYTDPSTLTSGKSSVSIKCTPPSTKTSRSPPVMSSVSSAAPSIACNNSTSVSGSPTVGVSCSIVPLASIAGLSTSAATSSMVVAPSTVFSAQAQLLAPMPTTTSISSSMSTPLPSPMALPISAPMPIPLTAQLGIPMQTSGNVPLSVPMSGTMTLPLQVGSFSSGTQATAPFLLQSTLAPMLAPGQAIMKKESGNIGGMPNPVGNAPLMMGMNPLVVNSNRGAFFLSSGSTMTMTSSQQQMVPGSLMPSLLSLRLPDKPQQTIVASSPLYVPFNFANPGIIQTQGHVQPQIQTMSGVSTITAMASNIQNTVTTNMQNSVPSHIQNTVAANIQNAVTANIQNAVASNIQNAAQTSAQNVAGTSIQNATSISSAMTLTHGQGTGTGMKRQLVLATKNGPVSKLILSVGEDGSHVLAAASPNAISTSEGQTLMSVMQPVQSMKPGSAASQSLQIAPIVSMKQPSSSTTSKLTLIPKGSQLLGSVASGSQMMKQTTGSPTNVAVNSSVLLSTGNTFPGTQNFTPTISLPGKTLHSSLTLSAISGSPQTEMTAAKPIGLPSGTTITNCTSSIPTTSFATSVTKCSILPKYSVSSPASSSTVLLTSTRNIPFNVSYAPSESLKLSAASSVMCNRTASLTSTPSKLEMKTSSVSMNCPSTSPEKISSSALQTQDMPSTTPLVSVTMTKAGSCVGMSPGRPVMSVTSSALPNSTAQTKVTGSGSPLKSVANTGEGSSQTSSRQLTPPILNSRIPSAHAALAALKSPSGAPAPTRAIAKTGSSRKPYSSAASYVTAKPPDSNELGSGSAVPLAFSSSSSQPQDSSQTGASPVLSTVAKPISSQLTHKLNTSPKVSSVKPSSPLPINKSSTSPSASEITDAKRKGTEVELASTHRTLTMLSTAFQGIAKERKRDVPVKRTIPLSEISRYSEKQTESMSAEKSDLESLAEVASLVERPAEGALSGDKRGPEHSLWANPAQILGRETLRVPGLPITANVGTNLPTKNDLAKMKSGAVLADAVDKRSLSDIEKLCKVKGGPKGSPAGTDSEKSSVSGLLTSSKADTPRQKVQKWLEDGSKGDIEHKRNCGLLSNGPNCTCDVMEEDISNLNSLAEVCVSMERINSPSKDSKSVKPSNKIAVDMKKRQVPVESLKSSPQNLISPAKSSLPLDSHQMKVTWQNAFGVKSPSRSTKCVNPVQPKRSILADDVKTNHTSSNKNVVKDEVAFSDLKSHKTSVQKKEKSPRKKDETSLSSSTSQSPQDKKLAQRRSLLGRAADLSQSKLDSCAFSADNESSVYAFEADTDTPPVSKPFRRRSKTSSRSDEEDSTSMGSTSTPAAVHVSKNPVHVPIQVETDENPTSSELSGEVSSDKNGILSNESQNDDRDVYYVPIGGQGGHGDKSGKGGSDKQVLMSAKLVKKPPTFKHPNDTSEEGLPNKRLKMEPMPASLQASSTQLSFESQTQTSRAQGRGETKVSSQNTAPDSRTGTEKNNRETSRSSALDSSSEDTSSLSHMPSSSKDMRDPRSSMSPASSRNRSPMSDKASPSASHNSKSVKGRLNRQSSIDSDASEKAKTSRRGSKTKSTSSRASPSPSLPSTSSASSGPSRPAQKSNRSYNGPVPGNVSEAPVFHPTEREFQDPYAYIEKIRPIAEKYGLCRIVAPQSFKPDCNVEDDIRFTADNQYVHKMMDRWGPNAKEMRAIVKYVAQHNIPLKHPPLVGGMELDLPRLYTTVQNFGGLMEVMDKKRWVKVAETLRIPKSAQDRASKLDEVYCKCLLPYETLKTGERDNLFEMVEVEWEMRKERRDKRLAASAASPDEPVPETQPDEEEEEEEEDSDADEEDECIVKGRSMPLTTFYRTARNTTHMWFKGSSPSASEVEHEFWRHVRDRNFHICVNAGSVDCSDPPYGFPIRNSPFAKHPWNLKVFSNSNGSVLRSLGSVIGVTVPTLHFGMVFTTCCWYRDPHGLPWVEYLHTGAKKIWYGIPEHGSEKFHAAMQEVAPHYVRKKALWLASDTAMIPPNMLTERKVPLCRTVQEPGQFIVVFPRAHTSSVATGYIVSESVSFAPPNWLLTAMDSFREMQKCNEPPLFSLDKLIFAIAEDPRSTLNVLNTILSSVMEILEREITCQQELKKKGITSSERIERTKRKSSGKKAKAQKEAEEMETMECEVCSTILFLSMVLNKEDQSRYCLVHASSYVDQDKLNPSQCKLLYTYTQNELHEFCQTLLDRIEAKSGKKGNNFSCNNSDSGSSASTSTRN